MSSRNLRGMMPVLKALAVGLAVALSAVMPNHATAQTTASAAYVVNDRAITEYEIAQRILLLQAFRASGNLRALAIEQLTADRLRLQAAELIGIELDEAGLEAALAQFAGARNLTPEQVQLGLRARGIALESLQDFLRAGASWREVVRVRFGQRATPSESDLDTALGLARRGGQESVLLQELAIPNAVRGDDETALLARELSRSLNRGGNFNAAVQRYSRAASARRGGRLNWLPASNLPPAVAAQVLALLPGEVSAPISVPQGTLIFKLLDRREDAAAQTAAAAQDTLVYSQLIVSLPSSAPEEARQAAESQLEAVRDEASLCSDLDAQAGEYDVGSGRSEPTPASGVPTAIARTLAGMDVGQKVVQRDARGVVLVMLCSRGSEISGEEREALRQRIFNQRISALAQGYLQELRADAVIETR